MKKFEYLYNISRIGTNYFKDTDSLGTECDEIQFWNQGLTDVKIFFNQGAGFMLLKPDTGRAYSNTGRGKEVSDFKIVFTGGTGNLYIEKGYYTFC